MAKDQYIVDHDAVREILLNLKAEDFAQNALPRLDADGEFTGDLYDPRVENPANQPDPKRLQATIESLRARGIIQTPMYSGPVGEPIPGFQVADPYQSEDMWDSAGNIFKMASDKSLEGMATQLATGKSASQQMSEVLGTDSLEGFEPTWFENLASEVLSFFSPASIATMAFGGGVAGKVLGKAAQKTIATKLVARGVSAKNAPRMAKIILGRGAKNAGKLGEVQASALKEFQSEAMNIGRRIAAKSATSAGALGAYEGAANPLAKALERGETDFGDALKDILGGVVHGIGLGGAVGAAGGAVPGKGALSSLGRFGAEVGVFGSAAPVVEGRMPTVKDYQDAASFLAAMKLAHGVTKLRGRWREMKAAHIKQKVEREGRDINEVVEEEKNRIIEEAPDVEREPITTEQMSTFRQTTAEKQAETAKMEAKQEKTKAKPEELPEREKVLRWLVDNQKKVYPVAKAVIAAHKKYLKGSISNASTEDLKTYARHIHEKIQTKKAKAEKRFKTKYPISKAKRELNKEIFGEENHNVIVSSLKGRGRNKDRINTSLQEAKTVEEVEKVYDHAKKRGGNLYLTEGFEKNEGLLKQLVEKGWVDPEKRVQGKLRMEKPRAAKVSTAETPKVKPTLTLIHQTRYGASGVPGKPNTKPVSGPVVGGRERGYVPTSDVGWRGREAYVRGVYFDSELRQADIRARDWRMGGAKVNRRVYEIKDGKTLDVATDDGLALLHQLQRQARDMPGDFQDSLTDLIKKRGYRIIRGTGMPGEKGEVIALYPEDIITAKVKPDAGSTPAPSTARKSTVKKVQEELAEVPKVVATSKERRNELRKKEIWQLTQSEYVELIQLERGETEGKYIAMAPSVHRSIVREGVETGKPVPAEVLKDYPDLKPRVAKAKKAKDIAAASKPTFEKPHERGGLAAVDRSERTIVQQLGHNMKEGSKLFRAAVRKTWLTLAPLRLTNKAPDSPEMLERYDVARGSQARHRTEFANRLVEECGFDKNMSDAQAKAIGEGILKGEQPEYASALEHIRQRLIQSVRKWGVTIPDEKIIGRIEKYLPRTLTHDARERLLDSIQELKKKHPDWRDPSSEDALVKTLKAQLIKQSGGRIVKDVPGFEGQPILLTALEYIRLNNKGKVKSIADAMKILDRRLANDVLFMESAHEKHRTQMFPSEWFETDIRKILPEYINSMAKRIGEIDGFGWHYEKYIELLSKIDKFDHAEAVRIEKAITQWNGVYYLDKGLSRGLRKASDIYMALNVGTKIGLGRAPLLNLTQWIISFCPKVGVWHTAAAFGDLFSKSKRARLAKAGVVDQYDQKAIEAQLGTTPGGWAGKFAELTTKWSGFSAINKINLYWSAAAFERAVKQWIPQARKSGRLAKLRREQLKEFGIDYKKDMTDEQLSRGMYKFAMDSQLQKNVFEEPAFFQEAAIRPLVLFKRFGYRQAAWIGEMLIKETKRGNIMPLIRMAVGGIAGGGAMTWALENIKEALSDEPQYHINDGIVSKVISNLSIIGSVGFMSDMIELEKMSDLARRLKFTLFPVLLSDIERVEGAWTATMRDWERYGDGWLATKRNAYRAFDFAGSYPKYAARRLKTVGQRDVSFKKRRSDEKRKIFELFLDADQKGASRHIEFWNKNFPTMAFSVHEFSMKELGKYLKRQIQNKVAVDAKRGSPEFKKKMREQNPEWQRKMQQLKAKYNG